MPLGKKQVRKSSLTEQRQPQSVCTLGTRLATRSHSLVPIREPSPPGRLRGNNRRPKISAESAHRTRERPRFRAHHRPELIAAWYNVIHAPSHHNHRAKLFRQLIQRVENVFFRAVAVGRFRCNAQIRPNATVHSKQLNQRFDFTSISLHHSAHRSHIARVPSDGRRRRVPTTPLPFSLSSPVHTPRDRPRRFAR